MESEFKKNVFDEKLFQYSLELLELIEKLEGVVAPKTNSAPGFKIVRKTLLDAFTTNDSLADLYTFLRTINQLDLTSFHLFLPAFFENANLTKRHDQTLFDDYLATVRHLAASNNFILWGDFFKSLHAVGSQSSIIAHEFLTTIRHLASREELPNGQKSLIPNPKLASTDALSEAPLNRGESAHCFYTFTSWEEFFKATTTVSSKTELIVPFLVTVRHSLNYLKKAESIEGTMKVLTNQSALSAFEAYSYGQLESKKWLLQETRRVRGNSWGVVFVLAGWIGSLSQLIFDSDEVEVAKIRSFDIDGSSCKLAERLNNLQVLDQWKFKAVNMDISMMKYPTEYFVKRHDGTLCELYDQPDLVINTSCEHIENLEAWWSKIPSGTSVVLQNNNAFHIADHINCVKSLEEFKAQLPLAKIDFAGELPLTDYTRYMLIGVK